MVSLSGSVIAQLLLNWVMIGVPGENRRNIVRPAATTFTPILVVCSFFAASIAARKKGIEMMAGYCHGMVKYGV